MYLKDGGEMSKKKDGGEMPRKKDGGGMSKKPKLSAKNRFNVQKSVMFHKAKIYSE